MIKLEEGQQLKVKARAVEVLLGNSANKGTPQIAVIFVVTEGEHGGDRIPWTGYFTEKTSERTIESLQACGWTGDDISVFAADKDTLPALNGLDRNEIELVLEGERYNGDNANYRDRVFTRAKWVNRIGGGGGSVNVENAMSKGDAQAFAQKIKGLIHASKQRTPEPTKQADQRRAF